MAEAVAALGLAANIFQFLEYGTKFVGTAWTIWKSGPESVEAFSTLQSLSSNIKSIVAQLQSNTADVSGTEAGQSEPERAIFAAAAECFKDAHRILDSLEKVGGKDPSVAKFSRKRDSGKAAFKLMWKSNDIQALEVKFERLKTQITLNLVASVRLLAIQTLDKQNEVLRLLVDQQRNSSPRSPDRQLKRVADEKGFGSAVVDILADGTSQSQVKIPSAQSMFAVLDNIEKGDKPGSTEGRDDVKVTLSPARRKRIQEQILEMLSYSEMHDREHSVAEAHKATFGWAFGSGQSWESLGDWLESDHQLYWVTGKAGSGKSTLMKYICEAQQSEAQASITVPTGEPRCVQHLKKWAGDSTLAVASFYFWAAGSGLQTSKEGLYRSLLYKLLVSNEDLIEHVFPRHWDVMSLFGEGPTLPPLPNLNSTLQRVIQLLTTVKKTKVCLFIDGLDEFDGDHEDLVQYLQGLLSTAGSEQYIKICVASRPWVVFGDAFLDKPSLRLEDLTFNDIKDYVSSRFRAGRRSSELLNKEPEFGNGLINEVVQKASGVFLWANLVVTSLLDGTKHGDRISDLRRRLDELPPDLESLYTGILDSLEPRHLEHAAQYFSLIEAHTTKSVYFLTVLLLSFADDDFEETTSGLGGSGDSVWTMERLQFRIDTMKTRLNSRCKGLIETIEGDSRAVFEGGRVQYLHRSVKDYIQTTAVQARLSRALTSPFDPHLRMGAALLALLKLVRSRQKGFLDEISWVYRWAQCLSSSIRQADSVADGCVTAMVRVLDETEQVFQDISKMDIYEQMESLLLLGRLHHVPVRMQFVNIVLRFGGERYLKERIPRSKVRPLAVLDDSTPRSFARVFKMRGTRNNPQNNMGKMQVSPETHQSLTYILAYGVTMSRGENLIPTIAFLLESGVDVNQPCDVFLYCDSEPSSRVEWKIAPWTLALAGLLTTVTWNLPAASRWTETVKLMLQNGADVSNDVIGIAISIACKAYSPGFSHGLNDASFSTGGKRRKKLLKRFRDYQKGGGELNLAPILKPTQQSSTPDDAALSRRRPVDWHAFGFRS